jgi:hypothetical protein
MSEELEKKALATAEKLARELENDGARAVILTGSWARGDAHRQSDLDLRVVGEEKPKSLRREDGFLVSTAWQPEDQQRETMKDPSEVGSIVPGWRSARILSDPEGVAAKLQKEAEDWSWDDIDDEEADSYVAKEITKLAEEVHSLYSNLDQEIWTGAAMQRSTIALETAPIMAVHHRLLYETEKKLWDLVAEQHGDDWTRAQEASLGENDESFRATCQAAYDLFKLAAEATKDVLNDDQRPVVEHAFELSPARLFDGE